MISDFLSRGPRQCSTIVVCPDALDRCNDATFSSTSRASTSAVRKDDQAGLVLEVDPRPGDRLSGCGVVATGHGRVVVEAIADAAWAGEPVRIDDAALDPARRSGDIVVEQGPTVWHAAEGVSLTV